jgi:ubiquinone/menaquinone biosynthesis C-methylase UbiE
MDNNEHPKIRNDFSKIASAYSKYRRDYIDKVYDLIYKFCPDKKSNVLDVGCGTGLVANHLAGYYNQVTGTDKSREMLDIAKSLGRDNTSFIVSPTEQLPFENNSFDLVTAAAAYHWFDHDKAGKEIYRVLKPKGKLCVFWKYAPKISGYLPEFALENLRKFVSDIPKTNKELVSENTFLRVGFSKINDEEVDFDDAYSKEEILGHIQSHSTFNLLDDAQKEQYKKLNEKSVGRYLVDGKYIFKSRMEMWFVEK